MFFPSHLIRMYKYILFQKNVVVKWEEMKCATPLQGMEIALTVIVDGHILETNATHREGSKITFVEMDN